MIWITADDVIQIHSRVIQRSGGMDGRFLFSLKKFGFSHPMILSYPQTIPKVNLRLRQNSHKS